MYTVVELRAGAFRHQLPKRRVFSSIRAAKLKTARLA
jgi:hypothetical protein